MSEGSEMLEVSESSDGEDGKRISFADLSRVQWKKSALTSSTFLALGNLQARLHCTRLIERVQMLILHGAGLASLTFLPLASLTFLTLGRVNKFPLHSLNRKVQHNEQARSAFA